MQGWGERSGKIMIKNALKLKSKRNKVQKPVSISSLSKSTNFSKTQPFMSYSSKSNLNLQSIKLANLQNLDNFRSMRRGLKSSKNDNKKKQFKQSPLKQILGNKIKNSKFLSTLDKNSNFLKTIKLQNWQKLDNLASQNKQDLKVKKSLKPRKQSKKRSITKLSKHSKGSRTSTARNTKRENHQNQAARGGKHSTQSIPVSRKSMNAGKGNKIRDWGSLIPHTNT